MSHSTRRRIVLGFVVVVVAAQFIRPDRTNPAVVPEQALEAGGHVPAQVVATLKRGCYDCHAHTTIWPWYTNVTPVSWMMADHVNEGRQKLNFSTWNTLPAKRRVKELEKIQRLVTDGEMPLASYLLIHRDAKMSDDDKQIVSNWTSAERARLMQEEAIATMPAFAPTSTYGGFVYVSGILPGAAIAPPSVAEDIRRQTTRVLDELKARLAKAGTSLDRVVTLSVYLKRAEDFAAMNQVWAKYWPKDPPSRTTVIAGLPSPGALIQVTAIAATPDTPRQTIHPKAWLKSPSPYSYAVKSGDTLFLAGLVARRGVDNTTVNGDITVQTRTVLENAKAILAEAGFGFNDVVSARVFLTDVANFARMNETYRSAWPKDPPARATVITGLTNSGYLVEITFVAVKGGARVAYTTPIADGTAGIPSPNLSGAINIGPRLFASGMLGIVPGKTPDAALQAREILARLGRTIALGGAQWSNVIESVVYVTDLGKAPAVLNAFRAQVGPALPVGTLVVSGLVSPGGLAEIMLTTGK
ncbi:MAG: heme-binding domain-containing protein [Acidobacteria bacterium]|nr:heme-binding domain-containing protein [Acidobacteriota bacterium]